MRRKKLMTEERTRRVAPMPVFVALAIVIGRDKLMIRIDLPAFLVRVFAALIRRPLLPP